VCLSFVSFFLPSCFVYKNNVLFMFVFIKFLGGGDVQQVSILVDPQVHNMALNQ
jgi:hypothetical protein